MKEILSVLFVLGPAGSLVPKYKAERRACKAAQLTDGCRRTPACPRFRSPQLRVAMDGQPALSKIGLAVLACNSALAIWNSWGDAGSVAFVFVADAALLLLFSASAGSSAPAGAAGAPGRRCGR